MALPDSIAEEKGKLTFRVAGIAAIASVKLAKAGEHVSSRNNLLLKNPSDRTEEDIDLLLKICQSVNFIKELPVEKRRMIAKAMVYQHMREGETVFNAGDIGTTFYILMSGSVGIYIPKGDSEIHVATMRSGDSFGELALMSEDSARAATIRTLFKCDFLIVNKQDYDFIIKSMQDDNLGSKVEFLEGLPVFKETTRAQLQALALCVTVKVIPAKTVVIRQGGEAEDLFFVKRGELRVVKAVGVDRGMLGKEARAHNNSKDKESDNPFDVADRAARSKHGPGGGAPRPRGLRSSTMHQLPGTPARAGGGLNSHGDGLRRKSHDEDLGGQQLGSHKKRQPGRAGSTSSSTSKEGCGRGGGKAFLEINNLKRGDYFGEMGILGGGKVSSSIISTTACELLVVAKFDALRRIQDSTMEYFKQRIRMYSQDEDVQDQFVKDVQWDKYKKNLVDDVLGGKSSRSNTYR